MATKTLTVRCATIWSVVPCAEDPDSVQIQGCFNTDSLQSVAVGLECANWSILSNIENTSLVARHGSGALMIADARTAFTLSRITEEREGLRLVSEITIARG